MQFPVLHGELHGKLFDMIERPHDSAALTDALARSPVVLLVGARQTGKTTMARSILSSDDEAYFDLEDPRDLARLDQPMLALEGLTGVVVVDEVQRRPDLFPILRVLADRAARPATFLVLGSASPSALRQSAESLAGRLEILELGGLGISDVGADRFDDLWLRGGFPWSFLAPDDPSSIRWEDQLHPYPGDTRRSGIRRGPSTRNDRTLPRSRGSRSRTAVEWRRAGTGSRDRRDNRAKVPRRACRHDADPALRPWHENLAKRQVRSPKVYFRDSGLVHTLLGIDGRLELLRHA